MPIGGVLRGDGFKNAKALLARFFVDFRIESTLFSSWSLNEDCVL